MQTIITKFHGPTDRKGSRVSATSTDGERVTLPWDHSLNSRRNHDAAARALASKRGWTKWPFECGELRNGRVYVPSFVAAIALSAIENLDWSAWKHVHHDSDAYRDLLGVPSIAEACEGLRQLLRAEVP